MRDSRNAVTLAPFALWDERSRTVGKQKSVYSELSKIALRNPIMTLIYEGAHLTEDGSDSANLTKDEALEDFEQRVENLERAIESELTETNTMNGIRMQ